VKKRGRKLGERKSELLAREKVTRAVWVAKVNYGRGGGGVRVLAPTS